MFGRCSARVFYINVHASRRDLAAEARTASAVEVTNVSANPYRFPFAVPSLAQF